MEHVINYTSIGTTLLEYNVAFDNATLSIHITIEMIKHVSKCIVFSNNNVPKSYDFGIYFISYVSEISISDDTKQIGIITIILSP